MGRIMEWIEAHRQELESERSLWGMSWKASKLSGIPERDVRRSIKRMGLVPKGIGQASPAISVPSVVPEKLSPEQRTRECVRKAVAALTDDEILSQAEFIGTRMVQGYSSAYFRKVIADPEFRAFQLRKGKQLYWCTSATKEWALSTVSGVRDI